MARMTFSCARGSGVPGDKTRHRRERYQPARDGAYFLPPAVAEPAAWFCAMALAGSLVS
jgi:hypothetical protein